MIWSYRRCVFVKPKQPPVAGGGGTDSVEVSTFFVLGMRWSEIDSYLQDRDSTLVPAGRRFPTPRTRNALV